MSKELHHIKKAQKEALLLRELSQLFLQITLDDSRFEGVSINRVELSRDKSTCTIYFYSSGGLERFEEIRPILVLYKASMRKALSQQIPGRYVPNLFFKFDENFDKQMRLETILNAVKPEEE